MTLQELYDKAWKEYWDKPRFRNSGWAKEVKQYWEKHLEPTFGRQECNNVTAKAVRQWHKSKSSIPTTANRCLEVLSKLFTFGQEEELCTTNPCRLVRANIEKKRHRYATEDEITKIGVHLLKEMEVYPREVAFIYLLALTGARPRSLSRAKRTELIRRDGVGILQFQGKTSEATGEPETVIICKEGLELLDKLPKRQDGLLIGDVYYRSLWRRIRRDANVPNLWLRDLRRTFATTGLSSGIGLNQIGKLLNHRSTQTTERYAKLIDKKRIEAAITISTRVGSLLNGKR